MENIFFDIIVNNNKKVNYNKNDNKEKPNEKKNVFSNIIVGWIYV